MITGTDDLEYQDLKARFFREPANTRKNATLARLEGDQRACWLRAFNRAKEYGGASSEEACQVADLALHTRKANPQFCSKDSSPGTEGATWERPKGHIGDAGPGVWYRLRRAEREGESSTQSGDDGSNYEPYSLPYPDRTDDTDPAILPSTDRAGITGAGPAPSAAVRAAGEPAVPRGLGAQGHLSSAGEVQ